jgi:recombination protein RecR
VDPFLPPSLQQLVRILARFPSVGERSALRLALFLLRQAPDFRAQLGDLLTRVGSEVGFCPRCRNLSALDAPCALCANPQRDASQMCVVEGIPDLIAIEHSGQFHGLYHVLHGVLSPMKGVGPDQLGVAELASRVRREGVVEVIVSTNMSVEGEATAHYLAQVLAATGVKVTRIAAGIPMGGNLEFLDGMTIGNALRERREMGR